jgi:hypothetical protein
MNEQLVTIAKAVLEGFGPRGATTEQFWPALLVQTTLAPTDPGERSDLLDAMGADIVGEPGSMRVVFVNGASVPDPV